MLSKIVVDVVARLYNTPVHSDKDTNHKKCQI